MFNSGIDLRTSSIGVSAQKAKYSKQDLQEQASASAFSSWMNDEIGDGLKNTQQLSIDWSKWENHVFFNSAEAKANIAIDKIINRFPFDGTSDEKASFYSTIDGYTNWLLAKYSDPDGQGWNVGYGVFTGGKSVWTKDLTGWLVPELSRKQIGETPSLSEVHNRGLSIEFWFNHATGIATNVSRNSLVLQKLKDAYKGVTVAVEKPLGVDTCTMHFHISSSDYLSIVSSIEGIPCGEWNHISFVYYRGKSERVISYLNGIEVSTTVAQSELEDIESGGANIYVGGVPNGTGQQHSTQAGTSGPWAGTLESLEGAIDELRLWSTTRSVDQIKKHMHRNINAQPGLTYYLKFNEPGNIVNEYNKKNIVIDYSGNAYHSSLYEPSALVEFFQNSGTYGTPPMSHELPKDNVVLFPDWPFTLSINEELVKSANNYDKNNPNLITRLVPRHYFEEAQFFEGIEVPLDEPMVLEQRHTDGNSAEYSKHDYRKVPSKTIMMSFLMVWAAYFDDIKLYIDSFSSLDKVSYTGSEQIPEILLNFLTDYYDLPMINPFNNETLDKYQEGQNIVDTSTGSLNSLVQQLWRRILVNMPFLLRSRGTIQGIKALMNTIGIESDSFFKLREFGGSLDNTISSSRIEQTQTVLELDFSDGGYANTPSLQAYRHEPGAPDPYSGPQEGTVLFQSGDITISTPDIPGPMTQFLSGSWSVEGLYQLDPNVATQSLFSLVSSDGQTDTCLVNLVAKRSEGDPNNEYMELTLHSTPYITGSLTEDNSQITISNIDLWDGSDWYVGVSNQWAEDSRVLNLYVGKTSLTNIVEWHSVGLSVPRDASEPAANLIMTNPTLSHKLYVGNIANIVNPFPASNNKDPEAHSYSGKLYGLKFWTSAITSDQAMEHCKNPLSISATNPQINDPTPRYYLGTKVHEYNGLVRTDLPSGGWERLRNHYAGLEGLEQAQNTLIDATQNEYDLVISGANIKERKLRYSTVSDLVNTGMTENKIRVRSYQDENLAKANKAHWGELYELPLEVGIDDRRFSIESSIVHALNKDMINLLGDMDILNEYIGAPELEYAVDYPEIRRVRDLYFKRLTTNMPYNSVIEFQRWFNNNFSSLIEDFVPYTADFLGINFVIESHLLERHKMHYKQGDVHVALEDRLAISQVPIIMGTATNNIV